MLILYYFAVWIVYGFQPAFPKEVQPSEANTGIIRLHCYKRKSSDTIKENKYFYRATLSRRFDTIYMRCISKRH